MLHVAEAIALEKKAREETEEAMLRMLEDVVTRMQEDLTVSCTLAASLAAVCPLPPLMTESTTSCGHIISYGGVPINQSRCVSHCFCAQQSERTDRNRMEETLVQLLEDTCLKINQASHM